MAKAKKSESAPKKTPAKKAVAKKSTTTTSASQPMVDTTLAAQNAAKLLAAKLPHKAGTGGGSSAPQSAMFKNLKEGLSKPHLTGLDNILDKSAQSGGKPSN